MTAAVEAVTTESDEKQTGPTSRWVAFVLGDETYAVPVTSAQEIVNVEDIAEVAGAPGFVLGIVNLRGTVVTVLDLNKKLMLPSRPWSAEMPVMVLESGPVAVGVVVDGIREVVDIPDENIEPPPAVVRGPSAASSSGFITGVANIEDEIYILIDVNQMLAEAREAAEKMAER
ncbi:MAG: chemotaxis protein CheW [bacterium]